MDLLTRRYSENLTGVLSCYDRIVITGTLPGACFAEGMTSFLYSRGIRIFDYPQFALPLRERIRDNAQALVRNGDRVELLSNICRHRQAIMLKGRGNAQNIVCPIHRWTYDLQGELLGAPNGGLRCMFQMMNEARIMVGVNAAATASVAFHESVAYARERRQGRPLGVTDAAVAQVPLV